MLRRYTIEQAAQKLDIDDAELGFLLHHLRETLSAQHSDTAQTLTEKDVELLARAYTLWREQGIDPTDIRILLRDENTTAMSSERQANTLAFCSGRPGVGKSVLIANLAAALMSKGHRTTIFDGSLETGGLWESQRRSPEPDHWITTFRNGTRLIHGKAFLADNAPATDTHLAEIEARSDFILVDTGSGTSDNALRFAMAVDETIDVTTPDVGVNADCFSIIRMLKSVDPDLRISVIVNRATTLGEAREAFARLNGAARKTGLPELPDLGWVGEDEELRKCAAKGETVIDALPTSPSAKCINRIADHLSNRLSPVERRGNGLVGLIGALRHSARRETAATDLQ